MELIVDLKAGGGKRKHPLQERFDKLRKQLETGRRRNARFRQDLDELVEVYNRRSVEHDASVLGELVALSEKLIAFAGRKSLSEWHREDLDDWLRELVEQRVAAVDPSEAERLRLDYREAVARSMDLSVDELDSYFGVDGREFEDEFDAAEQDEASDTGPWEDDFFGFDEDELSGSDGAYAGSDTEAQDFFDVDHAVDPDRTVMDAGWAKSVFRRAAQALHPDREPDPARRKVKEARMRDLLEARKEDDIMTMLTIYGESVSDAELVLGGPELASICDTLEEQLADLESDRQEYIHAHPIRSLVFDLFYHSSKKKRVQSLRDWEQDLKSEATGLRKLIASLRNLTCLKSELVERRDERMTLMADMLIDEALFR